jgi:hypothetical protein
MPSKKHQIDTLSYPLLQYPIAFIDYLWVITIYAACSFILAIIIDGNILPKFDITAESDNSSWYLGLKVLLQLAIQGFIAFMLYGLLQKISSPVNGWFQYSSHTSLGILVRNPAIISVILSVLSTSMRERLLYLFSRFSNDTPSPNNFVIPVNVYDNRT